MTEVVRSLRRVIRIVMVISEATIKETRQSLYIYPPKTGRDLLFIKKKGLGVK